MRFAPDRSGAYLKLAEQAEDEQTLFYRLLALRENALLDPAMLREMAGSFQGAQRRFLLNRARVQEGKAVESGEEERPEPPPLIQYLCHRPSHPNRSQNLRPNPRLLQMVVTMSNAFWEKAGRR